MLKRIAPSETRLGMFIDAIEGSWADHPFWRGSFLLERPKDLKKLQSSKGITVLIDTEKGVDTAAATADQRTASPAKFSSPDLLRALQSLEHSKPLITGLFDSARMGGAINASHALQAVGHIAECTKSSPRALIEVTRLKKRDQYTFLHSVAVSGMMVHLARVFDLDEATARNVGIGGLLHDIGKMRVPLKILNKTGPLTEREIAQTRLHPRHGYELLAGHDGISDVVLDICLHHHERIDGRGYPSGLSGDQISLPVRICSICDVYDALTTQRPYKKAMTATEAARLMLDQAGQFDRKLMMKFFYTLKI